MRTWENPMTRFSWFAGGVLALFAYGAAVSAGLQGPAAPPAGKYPAPRFPAYLKPTDSIDLMMPKARAYVRNNAVFQGRGMGIIRDGERIALVAEATSDDLVVEAVRRALEERKIKVDVFRDYELAGVPRADVVALQNARAARIDEGYVEAPEWIQGNFANPNVPKEWLKAQFPDLYAKLWPPSRQMTPKMLEVREKLETGTAKALIKYFEANPDSRGVFWGKGGSTFVRRRLHPFEEKHLGLFMADNKWDLMSEMGEYPSDVWALTEEQTTEPVMYVDRIEIEDPEGTRVAADIPQDVAAAWAQGVYHRGHLFMGANEATAKFGYSVVDYPAFQKGWLPPVIVAWNGTVAGTGHRGFYPRVEVHLKDGYVVDVKGGGTWGDAFRAMLKYPKINDTTFLYHKRPGFWWLYEVAIGTQPKGFRNPVGIERGQLSLERQRSGIIHWAFGSEVVHSPQNTDWPAEWLKFTAERNLPRAHGFHIHTYFATYKVRLRNANRWVTLFDRGHMTSLDSPEVRALASRYGDPNRILAEDWIAELPGINAPGNYADYAADPWKVVKPQMDRIYAGTYQYYHPPKGK
jgi:hypothetical protein